MTTRYRGTLPEGGASSSEDYVIGCCLNDEGATVDKCVSAGLEPAHLQRHAKLYSKLRHLRGEGTPIGLDTLIPLLNGEANVQELMALQNGAPTTAHVSHHLKAVLKAARVREEIRGAQARIEGLESGEIEPEGDTTDHARTLADLESRRVRVSAPPVEPTTRLWLADKPIATPGNIVTLISRAKTGKTATLGAATAAIIDASAGTAALGRDTFKFRATNPKGHAVLVFDTEQSPYDAYLCYKRSIDRSGQSADPDWLHHYSLVGLGALQLHKALDVALAHAAKQHHGIFCVILDGVADFVASVNDEAECNTFVTWLRSRTVTYECPAICVIHSNEGEKSGDDGRGHLGKQLIRKAESNLLLKKDGDVTTITSDKQRKAPITEADQVAFRWSDEAGMHVSCDIHRKSAGRPRSTLEDYLSVFPSEESKAMSFPVLLRHADSKRPIKRATFWPLVEQGVGTGEIQVDRTNVNAPKYWVRVPLSPS